MIEKSGKMSSILTIKGDFTSLFNSIKEFFIGIWEKIEGFFLQYLSQDVFNIFIFGIVVILILFILLAIMNRD